MPLLKHALKKQRRDAKKSKKNDKAHSELKKAVKSARKKTTPKTLSMAYKALDKAAKSKLIHPNKAARLKARLAKKIASK